METRKKRLNNKIKKLIEEEGSTVTAKVIDIINKGAESFFVLDAKLKTDYLLSFSEFKNEELPGKGDILKIIVNNKDSIAKRKKATKMELFNKLKKNKHIKGIIEKQKEKGYEVLVDGISCILNVESELEIGSEHMLCFFRINKERAFEFFLSVQELEIGDTIDCVVKGMNEFFFFVNTLDYNIDGIIHVSDLCEGKKDINGEEIVLWKKIKSKVLKIDTRRLILGVSQLKENGIEPKSNIESPTPKIGDIVEAGIENITENSLFVRIGDFTPGLVRKNEIFWNSHNKNLKSLYKIGDSIKAKIIDIASGEKRFFLSIKQLEGGNALEQFAKTAKIRDIFKGEVVNIKREASSGPDGEKKIPRYLFVRLKDGVDGILHISEMSWHVEESERIMEKIKIGDIIEVMLIKLDLNENKIVLSQKRKEPGGFYNMLGKLVEDTEYDCSFIGMTPEGDIKVSVGKIDSGIIRKYDIGKLDVSKLKAGDIIKARYLFGDKKVRNIYLSCKEKGYFRSNRKENRGTISTGVSFSDLI